MTDAEISLPNWVTEVGPAISRDGCRVILVEGSIEAGQPEFVLPHEFTNARWIMHHAFDAINQPEKPLPFPSFYPTLESPHSIPFGRFRAVFHYAPVDVVDRYTEAIEDSQVALISREELDRLTSLEPDEVLPGRFYEPAERPPEDAPFDQPVICRLVRVPEELRFEADVQPMGPDHRPMVRTLKSQ